MKRDIFISEKASEWLKNKIIQMGYGVRAVSGAVPRIGDHADLYHCRLGADTDAPVYSIDPVLVGSAYPEDCICNAACTGKYFIHRLDITDKDLLETADDLGMTMIDVPQGYTKCSVLVVDDDSIITSDRGIEKSCTKAGMDVLLIRPGNIVLDGFKYGFIGGASGRIEDMILFEGDITAHPDYETIYGFITSRGLDIEYNTDMTLTDIGSII